MEKQRQQEHIADYTLAVGSYKREQTRIKAMIHSALKARKKPKMTLEQLRNKLGRKLKGKSLSGILIQMREQGY